MRFSHVLNTTTPKCIKVTDEVTAVRVRMGHWQWEVNGLRWFFCGGTTLINCGQVTSRGELLPAVHMPFLRDAVHYSIGFDAGARAYHTPPRRRSNVN